MFEGEGGNRESRFTSHIKESDTFSDEAYLKYKRGLLVWLCNFVKKGVSYIHDTPSLYLNSIKETIAYFLVRTIIFIFGRIVIVDGISLGPDEFPTIAWSKIIAIHQQKWNERDSTIVVGKATIAC